MPKRMLIAALTLFAGARIASAMAQDQSASPPAIATVESADAVFAGFIRDFRSTAIGQGIAPSTYDAAMSRVARNLQVEAYESEQPEFTTPIWSYLDSMVSDRRVGEGRIKLLEYAALLSLIEAKYGVPKEVFTAIWGAETNYGEAQGTFNIFEALATLAYQGPRTDYGRRELIAGFKMVEKEHYDPAAMTSSWAGAFGQTQFVPSSFLAHAVDGDGDGRIDLWTSPGDALASTAALLDSYGWERGGPCEEKVQLPEGFDYGLSELATEKPVRSWTALGVKTVSGRSFAADAPAAIYLPAGARGPAFLVFHNFKVILKYNNAASYALAVCLLADRLAGGMPLIASWPVDEQPLLPDERIAFQTALKSLGYDAGQVDGILGQGTRTALRAWQKAHGTVPDGFPTKAILT